LYTALTTAQEEFEAVFVEACWQQYVIKVRVKAETVNDEQRIKSTIIDASPVDPIKECAGLIKAIKMYG
jgi:Replication factor-A C terminal domain